MTIDTLREYHQARPFHPFVLQLADGQNVEVRHPECLAYFPNRPRTVFVAAPNDRFKAIDIVVVAAIEPVNGHRQGASKRKRK